MRSSSSATTINDEDEDGSTAQQNECSQHTQGMHAFFRQLGERLRGATAAGEYDRVRNSAPSTPPRKKVIPPSPLRQARSFDSSTDIPCIGASEVVVPGSDLQKEMARLMAHSKLTAHDADECVICMEGFDPTNPRMPTLCGCGENRTFFHLPCLYQWLEQSENCPSCREKLNWDEFD